MTREATHASGAEDPQVLGTQPSSPIARWVNRRSALLAGAIAVAIAALAVVYHVGEGLGLGAWQGPALALLVDASPALVVAYIAYRLPDLGVESQDRWLVLAGTIVGIALTVSVIGATMFVRLQEARALSEPVFVLLTAASFGALVGALKGLFLAKVNSEAREAQTMRGAFEFVNGLIRHDLQNDLGIINARTSVVRNQLEPDDGEPEGLEDIQAVADKALDRIESTREVAEALTGDARLEPLDVSEVTADLAQRAREAYDAEITTDLADQAPVQANRGLRSVLDNVVQNAVEHNDAEAPRVEITVEQDDEQVRVRVADNGPGMPADQRDHLEAPDPSVSAGGLTLAGTLVQRYGGTVRVRDNQPRGTIVEIALPRAD